MHGRGSVLPIHEAHPIRSGGSGAEKAEQILQGGLWQSIQKRRWHCRELSCPIEGQVSKALTLPSSANLRP